LTKQPPLRVVVVGRPQSDRDGSGLIISCTLSRPPAQDILAVPSDRVTALHSATPVVGVPEALIDEGNGLLGPPVAAEAQTGAMLRLLDHDPLGVPLAARPPSTWRRDHVFDRCARRLAVEWPAARRRQLPTEEPGQVSTVED
jgi:hypothetical protein